MSDPVEAGLTDATTSVIDARTAALLAGRAVGDDDDDDVGFTDAELNAEMLALQQGSQDAMPLLEETDGVTDEPLQSWESASPSLAGDVDWMNALFNSDPRLPFQVLHLGALLCMDKHYREGDSPVASDSTGDPFEDLRAGRAPIQLGNLTARRADTSNHTFIAPALSRRLRRRPVAQRLESAVDEAIAARSSVALREFVSPEALAALGRHRASDIWGNDKRAKKSDSVSIKHGR